MNSEPPVAPARSLVLDANILVRVILGRRVPALLLGYTNRVHFLAPEHAFEEVTLRLPEVLKRRGLPTEAIDLLEQEIFGRLPMLVAPVPPDVYKDLEGAARRRLAGRDERDWPVLALALRLDCPIWTTWATTSLTDQSEGAGR